MASNPFPGGRHKTAPYKSTHLRVPEPIKAQLQKVVDIYKILTARRSEIGLGNFDLQLNKFIEGHNPLYGVTSDDFKLVDTRQFDELRSLYDALVKKNERLREQTDSEALKQKTAIATLTKALELKPNAGGAIKKEIKKAIQELEGDF